MAPRRNRSLAPVIFPFVIAVIATVLAFVIGNGVWMTTLLVVALVFLTFFLVAALGRIPGRRSRK